LGNDTNQILDVVLEKTILSLHIDILRGARSSCVGITVVVVVVDQLFTNLKA